MWVRHRESGQLGCTESYWQSCRGFHTALYALPPGEPTVWVSPDVGAGSDLSGSGFGSRRYYPPQWYGCCSAAAEEGGHVQTQFPGSLTQSTCCVLC